MSLSQQIETRLIAINDAVFQELCDQYLYHTEPGSPRMNRSGSMKGKQKVKKGTPDAWFQLDNGQYVLAEYTTQEKKGNAKAFLDKVKRDIDSCLKYQKTHLPKNRISKIIYCCNATLTLKEHHELSSYAADQDVRMDLRTLDTIAQDMRGRCAHITRDLLGIPVDSAQVLPPEIFVAEYERSGWATTLQNEVVGREQDRERLEQSLLTNLVTIVSGPPGVGKTRLALQAMQQFKNAHPTTTLFCISNKLAPIWEDLRRYLANDKDYLVLIDDANRQLPNLQILLVLLSEHRAGSVRLLITVRENALRQVIRETTAVNPGLLQLEKSSDEEIKALLQSADFNIQHTAYIESILRIADGNPRLAVMAARVALKTQRLAALYDVSDLYDKYFQQSIAPDLWKNATLLKTLGIISFFNVINLLDDEWFDKIERHWKLTRSQAIESLQQLEAWELVDMAEDRTAVRLADQVVGTYFFYHTFFKVPILDFSVVLQEFFDTHFSRILDTVVPANNAFGYENVLDKVGPFISSYWTSVKKDAPRALKFLEIFWLYKLDETLAFVHDACKGHPEISFAGYEYDEKQAQRLNYEEDKYLALLSKFYYHGLPQTVDALDLSVEYTRRHPHMFTQHCKQIEQAFLFTYDDAGDGYYRQQLLLQKIKESGSKDSLWVATVYQIMSQLMRTSYHITGSTRKRDAFTIIHYELPVNDFVKEFRSEVWRYISRTGKGEEKALEKFFSSYWHSYPRKSKAVYRLDLPFWIQLFGEQFSSSNFLHCHIVHDSVFWAKRMGLTHPAFSALVNRFEKNETYATYLHLQFDYYRGRHGSDERISHKVYEQKKETELREHFVLRTKKQWSTFLKRVAVINEWLRTHNKDVNHCLDKVFAIHGATTPKTVVQVMSEMMRTNKTVRYRPWYLLDSLASSPALYDQLLGEMIHSDFDDKYYWLLNAYWFIPAELISEEHAVLLANAYAHVTQYFVRMHGYEPFLAKVPETFHRILRVIYTQNENKNARLTLDWHFFENYLHLFTNDLPLLKKTYLQQEVVADHFDHDYKDWLSIIRVDNGFLMEYLRHWTGKSMSMREYDGLSIIWELDNAEVLLNEALDYLSVPKIYAHREDFANAFFHNLRGPVQERALQFMRAYRDKNLDNGRRMNMIFDCIRHSFEPILQTFLLEFLELNDDVRVFKAIKWTDTSFIGNGQTIWGGVRAEQYKNILDMVSGVKPGYKYVEHKEYLEQCYANARKSAEQERRSRFFHD